jgi:hypothetical protein
MIENFDCLKDDWDSIAISQWSGFYFYILRLDLSHWIMTKVWIGHD